MTTATSTYFHRDEHAVPVPLWREPLAMLEWLGLRLSPVFYGCGIERGNGAPVIAVPGFLGTDDYLLELYLWLGRIGYRPYLSRIGRNAECLDILAGRLVATVERASAETGARVHLVGHSLGGMLARSVAVQRPERIASVVTLGSPFRGTRSHPLVMGAVGAVRARIRAQRAGQVEPECFSGYCGCTTATALGTRLPGSIPQIAIYTRGDGVADWRFCINDDPETDIEVQGTHVGLAFNATVYRHLAVHLAGASTTP